MIALPTPISAVTAAAMQAELTHWLVAPTTIECPEFNCWRGRKFFVATEFGDSETCTTCDGSGRVPLVVNVGDRVTVPISDELPANVAVFARVEYGDWRLSYRVSGEPVLIHPTGPDTYDRSIDLHPGGSLSGTVAAIPDTTTAALPIIANELPYEVCPSIHMSLNGKMLVHDEPEWLTDISAELVWQDFTPGMQAFRLTDVTVTP